MEPGLTQFPGSTYISTPAASASRGDQRLPSGLQKAPLLPSAPGDGNTAGRIEALARLESMPASNATERLQHAYTRQQKQALSSYLDQQEFLNRQEQAAIFASLGVDLYV